MGPFHSILREWVGAQRSVPFAIIASRPLVVMARISHGQRLSKNSKDVGYFASSEDLGVRSRLLYHKARFNWHNWGGVGAVKGFHITANSPHNCLRHVYSIEAEEKKKSVIPRRRVTGLWMAPTYRHTMEPRQPFCRAKS